MGTATSAAMAVDWEDGVDLGRLRAERLARKRRQPGEASELGALLAFDFANGTINLLSAS